MLGPTLWPGAAAGPQPAPGWVLRDARGAPALLDIDRETGRFWFAGRSHADEAALAAAAGGSLPAAGRTLLPRPLPGEAAGALAVFLDVTTGDIGPTAETEDQAVLVVDKGDWTARAEVRWTQAFEGQHYFGPASFVFGLTPDTLNAFVPAGLSMRLRTAFAIDATRLAVGIDGASIGPLSGEGPRVPAGMEHLRIGYAITGYPDFGGTIHRVAVFAAADDGWLLARSTPPGAIAAWGDSLTAGMLTGGGFGGLFTPARLVLDHGVGGQTARQIAARQGAVPIELTLAGGAIPASGAAAVTARSVSPVTAQGPWIGGERALRGTLCGIAGVLAREAEGDDGANETAAMTFTRDADGDAAACPAGSRFVPQAAVAGRPAVALIWAGRNDAAAPDTVRATIAAMAARAAGGRYLVGAVPAGADDDAGVLAGLAALNAALAAAHGDRFVDLVAALQAGHDGSPDDLADIAAGLTPRSLRSDAVHLNAAGNALARTVWHDAVLAMGW